MYTARLTRISVLSRRKPGMSEEAYRKYWTERHGALVAPWLKRYGILKYTQVSKESTTAETISTAKLTEDSVPPDIGR
jgi:hypothetical protein